MALYNLFNRNQALEIFQVPDRKWYKHTAYVIISVILIFLYLTICDFPAPSIMGIDLCQVTVKQTRQYICLI
jgi:hypothetical protein